MLSKNSLKEKLLNNAAVLGVFQKFADPVAVELLALSKFHFAIIDDEHAQSNSETLFNNIRTAQGLGMHAIVRVAHNAAVNVLKALDMGASGIQVPNINTRADAEKLVSYARFSPLGVRGFGNTTRSGLYGTISIKEFMRRGNEETLISAHCETKEGVNNLAEIVQVEGIDVIFIGPGDLSQAYGCAGESPTPEFLQAIEYIIKTTLAAKKVVGIACASAQVKDYYARGVRFFACGTDHSYALAGAKTTYEAFLAGTQNP